jgi:hypothetical protein
LLQTEIETQTEHLNRIRSRRFEPNRGGALRWAAWGTLAVALAAVAAATWRRLAA